MTHYIKFGETVIQVPEKMLSVTPKGQIKPNFTLTPKGAISTRNKTKSIIFEPVKGNDFKIIEGKEHKYEEKEKKVKRAKKAKKEVWEETRVPKKKFTSKVMESKPTEVKKKRASRKWKETYVPKKIFTSVVMGDTEDIKAFKRELEKYKKRLEEALNAEYKHPEQKRSTVEYIEQDIERLERIIKKHSPSKKDVEWIETRVPKKKFTRKVMQNKEWTETRTPKKKFVSKVSVESEFDRIINEEKRLKDRALKIIREIQQTEDKIYSLKQEEKLISKKDKKALDEIDEKIYNAENKLNDLLREQINVSQKLTEIMNMLNDE